MARHPLGVGVGFARPLRVGEPRDDGLAVHQQAAVGGVHHVGQACDGLDQLDGVSEFLICLAQGFPLIHRDVGVDFGRRVHPRVDGVLDGEEGRRRHGVVADAARALSRGAPTAATSERGAAAAKIVMNNDMG